MLSNLIKKVIKLFDVPHEKFKSIAARFFKLAWPFKDVLH